MKDWYGPCKPSELFDDQLLDAFYGRIVLIGAPFFDKHPIVRGSTIAAVQREIEHRKQCGTWTLSE